MAIPQVTLQSVGFLLVYASGRNTTANSELHTDFKLTQTKHEHLVFSVQSGNILADYEITPTPKDHSWVRKTNGSLGWVIFDSPAPGYSNNGASHFTDYVPKPLFSLMP